MISIGGAVLAGLAGVIGVVIFANPAGAHTADLQGTPQCQADGTYTIEYTGHTMRSGLSSNVTVTDSTPSGTTITPAELKDVPGDSTFHLSQAGIPGSATSASLTVHVVWTDGYQVDASGDVKALTGCTKTATTAAPAFTNGTCQSPQPAYTIPDTEGVNYAVNGQTVAAGRHDAKPGDVITVTATAQKGYTLAGSAKWGPFTFAALPTNCATAPTDSQPSCATPNGSYTVPATEGVTYFVNGKQTKAGTYSAPAGSVVHITAFGSDGHALPGQSSWTFTMPALSSNCSAHVPTFVDNTCTGSGTYTIPDSTADYTVNDVAVAPGSHHATAGATVTIRAIARPGHPLVGTTSWSHVFPNLPQCAAPAANLGDSPPLANTGPDVPVGQASLIAGLLALVGAALMFAGRRPRTPGRHSAR